MYPYRKRGIEIEQGLDFDTETIKRRLTNRYASLWQPIETNICASFAFQSYRMIVLFDGLMNDAINVNG